MLQKIIKKKCFGFSSYKEEHAFVTFARTVDVVWAYEGRSIFSSAPLSNMSGMAYDRLGERLLVFNVSGMAHLYDMSTQSLLFSKLKLNKIEGTGDSSVAFFGNQCFYIDKKEGLSCLSMTEGSIKQVPEFQNKRLKALFQSDNSLYLFLGEENGDDSFVRIEEYIWQEGKLCFQREKALHNISTVYKIKRDFDAQTGVVCLETQGSHTFYLAVFEPQEMNLRLLDENRPKHILFDGFHTYLEKGMIAYATMDSGIVTRISTGEIVDRWDQESEVKMSGCCDVQFISPSELLFSSWDGLYFAESFSMYDDDLTQRSKLGDEDATDILDALSLFKKYLGK